MVHLIRTRTSCRMQQVYSFITCMPLGRLPRPHAYVSRFPMRTYEVDACKPCNRRRLVVVVVHGAADAMRRNAPRLTSHMRKLSHSTHQVSVRELPPVSVGTAGHSERASRYIIYGTVLVRDVHRRRHSFDHVTTSGMMICFHDY